MGTQSGRACQVGPNTIELKGVGLVRAGCVSGRKSSKGVQCVESQTEVSRLHAICLISLWAFQTLLLDWPLLTVTPAWTRTLWRRIHPTSIPKRIGTDPPCVPTSGSPTTREPSVNAAALMEDLAGRGQAAKVLKLSRVGSQIAFPAMCAI